MTRAKGRTKYITAPLLAMLLAGCAATTPIYLCKPYQTEDGPMLVCTPYQEAE